MVKRAVICTKCKGSKWYTPPNQRDTIHSQKCDKCCEHKQGRWQLEEHYDDNGKWCCLDGCGKVWKDEK